MLHPEAAVLDWVKDHAELFKWLTFASIGLCLVAMVATPIALVKIPADYFTAARAAREKARKKSPWQMVGKVALNLAGWVCLMAGVVMLIGPGQGLLVVLLGVMLADFPGKQRVQQWIVTRKKIFKTINWLRHKFHRAPLVIDDAAGKGQAASAAGPRAASAAAR